MFKCWKEVQLLTGTYSRRSWTSKSFHNERQYYSFSFALPDIWHVKSELPSSLLPDFVQTKIASTQTRRNRRDDESGLQDTPPKAEPCWRARASQSYIRNTALWLRYIELLTCIQSTVLCLGYIQLISTIHASAAALHPKCSAVSKIRCCVWDTFSSYNLLCMSLLQPCIQNAVLLLGYIGVFKIHAVRP